MNIEVKYLKRAKRLTIRVLSSRIVRVTAPLRTKESEIQNILHKYAAWILEKYKMIEDRPVPNKIKFITGEVLPFYGEKLILKIIDGKGQVERFGNELIVSVPVHLHLHLQIIDDGFAADRYIQKSLIKWYRAKAFEKIKERVLEYAEKLNVSAQKISLKNYKSRWGACSSKGDLIFNWQIISFEKNLFDYVVAHEVCHLKEMNHSPRFYSLLKQLGFHRSQLRKAMRDQRNLF